MRFRMDAGQAIELKADTDGQRASGQGGQGTVEITPKPGVDRRICRIDCRSRRIGARASFRASGRSGCSILTRLFSRKSDQNFDSASAGADMLPFRLFDRPGSSFSLRHSCKFAANRCNLSSLFLQQRRQGRSTDSCPGPAIAVLHRNALHPLRHYNQIGIRHIGCNTQHSFDLVTA